MPRNGYDEQFMNSSEPERPPATVTGHLASFCPRCGQEQLQEVATPACNLDVDCGRCGQFYSIILVMFTPADDDPTEFENGEQEGPNSRVC